MNEDQKELFKKEFSSGCSIYTFDKKIDQVTNNKSIWCFALPLKSDKNTYTCEINSCVTKENIDQYSFPLNKEEIEKIELDEKDYFNITYFSRNYFC